MKTFDDIVKEEFEKHARDKAIWKELQEWNNKPYWVQMAEEGDYMADGSDMQPYEPEEAE